MIGESILWSAFLVGIITACSMPLGALTSFIWQPKRRMLAFLIAFGGGALLAAVVIDLVGNVKEKGHLVELVVGSIIGSVFFIMVNQLVNNSGGFLRKPSTLVAYLTQQENRLLKRRMLQLKHLSIFQDLSEADLHKLAQNLGTIRCPAGTGLYCQGDPSGSLYLIEEGKIELLNPQSKTDRFTYLTANQSFDDWAFSQAVLIKLLRLPLLRFSLPFYLAQILKHYSKHLGIWSEQRSKLFSGRKSQSICKPIRV